MFPLYEMGDLAWFLGYGWGGGYRWGERYGWSWGWVIWIGRNSRW